MYDSVGEGSLGFGCDGRKEHGGWEVGAVGLREGGERDLRGFLVGGDGELGAGGKGVGVVGGEAKAGNGVDDEEQEEGNNDDDDKKKKKSRSKKLFDGLSIYINGSTAPLVSDHKLKYLLAEHGARVSIALGRRSVTHVVLGTPNGAAVGSGAGGGLAAGKMQKEIARVGGCGVKYVGVEWSVALFDCMQASERASERGGE